MLNFPLLSQAQPSRLLLLTTFSLSILATFGFNRAINNKFKLTKPLVLSSVIVSVSLLALWLAALGKLKLVPSEYLSVASRNLILPSLLLVAFLLSLGVKWANSFLHRNNRRITLAITYSLILLSMFDLLRFAKKFTPFSPQAYLFPQTKTTDFLRSDAEIFRIMSLDRRILPPNFAMAYKLQTIEGYDPLYSKAYAQLITQLETGEKKAIPIAFNRIISPTNINSELIDKLNVKYILALEKIDSQNLRLVFQEGETKIYQNTAVQPRSRLIKGKGSTEIIQYSPNRVVVNVSTEEESSLELADMMYPGWTATLDAKPTPIIASAENFRQVNIPTGKHQVIFFYQPLRIN